MTGSSQSDDSYFIGWFQFPNDIDANFEAVELSHHILNGISLFLNPLLLWMIVKNPGAKSWSNTSILVGSICVGNIVLNFLTLAGSIGLKTMTIAISTFIPNYYVSTFLLALNNYALIVEPHKYKTLAPESRTAVLILFLIWLGIGVIFIVAPLCVEDFGNYLKIMMTVVISISWLLSFVIMAMYIKILNALYRRKAALRGTLNVASARQGFRLIKQTTRLARLMFSYIAVLMLFSLPFYTSIILAINCPNCNRRANLVFILHMIPIIMSVSIYHALHWLFGTPQYFRAIKRLVRRVLVNCGLSKKQ